ncbi:MAG: phosphoribosylformylglycinamidine synthase subunit PurS [Candidatus Sifarchaeia archaeon]
MDLIHEGKVKRVHQDPKSRDNVIIEFTDVVTALDGKKREKVEGKGDLACSTTEFLLGYLEGKGIDTHFLKKLDGPRLLCRKTEIYPIEVVCRNVAAGSFCRRYGVKKGTVLETPIIEFFLKDDKLHDPLITDNAIIGLNLITSEILQFVQSVTHSVNYYLTELLKQRNLTLVDFKLEFGYTKDRHIVLADELSGDTMRIWGKNQVSMDKDVFREDKGDLSKVYTALMNELTQTKPEEVRNRREMVQVLVNPKDGIKNPPGDVTKKALVRLGFGEADDVRVGKIFNIYLRKPVTSEVLNHLKIMNIKLLSNPISEKQEVSFS